MQSSLIVKKTPFYYGWVILAVGTLGIIMTSPGQTYAVSVFTEYFIRDLGVSRSLVSTLYAAGTLIGSMALPLIGRQIDRRGSRTMVVVITIIFGAACVYMGGLVSGPLTLALGFVAIRMFGQGSLNLVSNNVINQWWVRRRGTIMGLSGLFVSLLGLGGFPSLINWLIPHYGWRMTYVLLGALLLLVMLPLGYLFFRERPEDFGLEPDGNKEVPKVGPLPAPSLPEENWTRQEALRTVTFWIVAGGLMVSAMMSTGLFFHMVSIFADNQLSPTVAASVYVPIAVMTALVTVGSGALIDRIPLRLALATSLFLLALALWMAQHLSSTPMAFLYGVILGGNMGLFRIVSSVAWAHYFGRRHLGSISGVASTVLIVGSAVGPIPLGVARDALGNYNLALTLLALLPLALGVASLFMPQPTREEADTTEA
ncbi:MAG TPA: MFS transporter [Candidatus Sulfomarinibacteraceae bacterium]|nr:MFS transporter [Candidatus Sulfomarinibacteraceae bacterium]